MFHGKIIYILDTCQQHYGEQESLQTFQSVEHSVTTFHMFEISNYMYINILITQFILKPVVRRAIRTNRQGIETATCTTARTARTPSVVQKMDLLLAVSRRLRKHCECLNIFPYWIHGVAYTLQPFTNARVDICKFIQMPIEIANCCEKMDARNQVLIRPSLKYSFALVCCDLILAIKFINVPVSVMGFTEI